MWQKVKVLPTMMKIIWNPIGSTGMAFLFLCFVAMLMRPTLSQSGNPHDAASFSGLGRTTAVASAQVAAAGNSMMASVVLSNGNQQVAMVDNTKATMAVYHIDSTTGDIQLKSVRKLDADFLLEEFNLSEPTPSTIRKNIR
jgi:hypothetical protein